MYRVLAASGSPYSSASATTNLPFEADENEEYDGLAVLVLSDFACGRRDRFFIAGPHTEYLESPYQKLLDKKVMGGRMSDESSTIVRN